MNGKARTTLVQDKSVKGDAKAREKADPANDKHVGAPIPAIISRCIATSVGKSVAKGDKVAVLEAMKMQTTIYASTDGTVDEILVQVGDSVESKDLIARLQLITKLFLNKADILKVYLFRVLNFRSCIWSLALIFVSSNLSCKKITCP